MPNKSRRIYTGLYRRFDGSEVQVILVTKDADTGEQILVCKKRFHGKSEDFFTMTKVSFCEMVETRDGPVPKYTRQTQHRESEGELYDLELLGFDVKARTKYRKKSHEEEAFSRVRMLHRSRSYTDFAQELCNHYWKTSAVLNYV